MGNMEWFKGLKVGDSVAVRRYRMSTVDLYIVKVKNITPKGFVRLESGELLKECRYYSRDSWSSGFTIEPVTDEIERKLYRSRLEKCLYSKIVILGKPRNMEKVDTCDIEELCKCLDNVINKSK